MIKLRKEERSAYDSCRLAFIDIDPRINMNYKSNNNHNLIIN